jgi:hypothetical protein
MDNFEEEVKYFVDLIIKNIQEAKSRKMDQEETIFNCINVSKDGQSVVIFNTDKDYCYEILKKDIEQHNFKNETTKYSALYYINKLLRYLNKETTLKEFLNIQEETNPVVKNIIQQKNNISEQLRLLRKYRNIPEVQEYIDKIYNDKFTSKYLKYLIDKYYYGKKNLIKPKKNGLETEFKMLLQ